MKISDPEIQKFIFDHEHHDETKLILKSKEIMGVSSALIADQVKARRKARTKLPSYYMTPGIVYPPSLNLEQSSSEATAIFKRDLVRDLISKRDRFCDLTCGFGIDSFFFSGVFTHGDVIEPNEKLIAIAKHNHELLGAKNITYHNNTAEGFLESSSTRYDLVYVDPSRRDDLKNRVFNFSDCQPNLRESSAPSRILRETNNLIIKASPILDIQAGIAELDSVKSVYIISVDNEVRELLFLCSQNESSDPEIICVNIGKENFVFRFSEERNASVSFSDPLQFIYEPNASIMKGGAFKSIANRFNLKKVDVNTHLYTSEQVVENFPGRIFRVIEHVKPDKMLREKFVNGQANILLRNYPMSVEELKKKTKITEGGDRYLIGMSAGNNKILVTAEKLASKSKK